MRPTLLFLIPAVLFAQSGGSIAGTVSDINGEALGKAQIQAVNTATKAVFKAESSPNGAYSLARLPAGSYDLTAMVPGMLPFQQQKIALSAGQTQRVNIRVQDFPTLNTLGDGREFLVGLITRHPTPAGPTPRAAGGKPDLSGVWHGSLPTDPGQPQLLPSAQKIVKERNDNNLKDFPQARCLPAGVTLFGTFLPYRVIQTPTYLAMISEVDSPNFRQIFLDGRTHPKNLEPTWMGHSIGHWEGDTLVVDTVGFNGKAWVDLEGRPFTTRMHLTERYTRPDLGHLNFEFTIDDPGAYVKPWTIKRTSDLTTNDEVQEFVCTENNKDVDHMVGK